jgi:hypothetical protein
MKQTTWTLGSVLALLVCFALPLRGQAASVQETARTPGKPQASGAQAQDETQVAAEQEAAEKARQAAARLETQLAQIRKQLLGPDPARPAGEEHTAALVSALRMDVPGAHAIVQELLMRHAEPELLPPQVLDRILERLFENITSDLSDTRLAQAPSDPSVQRWMQIYPSYIPVALELLAHARPELQEMLTERLSRFVRRMPGKSRREALAPWIGGTAEGLAKAKDALGLRRAAAQLAGASEDLDAAPLLAAQLDTARGPWLAALQDGLLRLTFRAVPFKNRSDYEAWARQQLGKSHAQLAKQAALLAKKQQRELRAHFEKELRELAEQQVLLALGREVPAWRALRDLLAREQLAFAQEALLELAYHELGKRELATAELNGSLPALRELHAWLEAGFTPMPGSDLRRAPNEAWLSLWALVSLPLGNGERAACAKRLLGLVDVAAAGKEARLLELLARFPGKQTRIKVLARAQKLHRGENPLALAAALKTIESLGLAKDAELARSTEELLASCVRNAALGEAVQQQALDILGGMRSPSVLVQLRELAAPDAGSELVGANMRLKAFAWVVAQSRALMTQRTGAELEAAESAQRAFLLRVLAESKLLSLRLAAVQALAEHPPSARNFDAAYRRRIAMVALAALQMQVQSETGGMLVKQTILAIQKQALRGNTEQEGVEVLVNAMLHLAGRGQDGAKLTSEELQRRRAMLSEQRASFRSALAELTVRIEEGAELLQTLAVLLNKAELREPALLLLRSPAIRRGLAGYSLSGGERKDWSEPRKIEFGGAWATALLAVLGESLSLAALADGDLRSMVLGAEDVLQRQAGEQPAAALLLGMAAFVEFQRAGDGGQQPRLELARKQLALFVAAALASDPRLPRARRTLAQAHLRAGAAAEAAKVLAAAKDSAGRKLLAHALLEAGRHQDAATLFAELAATSKEPADKLELELGELECLLELGGDLAPLAQRLAQVKLDSLEPARREALQLRLQTLRSRLEELQRRNAPRSFGGEGGR